MDRASTYLRAVVRFGLYAILFTPLLLWTRLSDPFLSSKILPFQILVDILLMASTACRLIEAQMKRRQEEKAPRRGHVPLLASLSLFLGYSLASGFLGIDIHRSFWGVAERQDGLMLWLHLLAWLIVLIWSYRAETVGHRVEFSREKRDKAHAPETIGPAFTRYLVASFGVSAAVAFTAIYQWLEERYGILWPVLGSLRSSLGERVAGVFGNPTFLGPYLLFHFFFGFYLISLVYARSRTAPVGSARTGAPRAGARRRARRLRRTVLIAFGQCLQLAAMLMGRTRGVLIGFALGLFVVAILVLRSTVVPRRLKVAASVLMLLFILVSLAGWIFRDSSFVKNSAFLSRMVRVSLTQTVTAWTRILAWQSALAGFREHPVIGWGHNNANYALNKYYNPEHVREYPMFSEPTFSWYDKSHNAYLDLLVEKGILGAIFYLVLLLAIVHSLVFASDRYLAFFGAGGLVSYLIANVFAFDSFGSMLGLFLFFGLLVLSNPQKDSPGLSIAATLRTDAVGISSVIKKSLRSLRRPVVAILLLLSALSLYLAIETGISSARYIEARMAFKQSPGLGLAAYDAAFQHYSPYRDRERLRSASLTIESALNQREMENRADRIRQALAFAEQTAAAFPKDVAVYMALADMCNNLGMYIDRGYLDKAEFYGKKAIELSPKRQEAAFYLGRTYVLRNEAFRAVELNRRMVADYPEFPVGHWFLALSLIADGQRDEAKREITKAWELGYRFRGAGEEQVARELFGESGYAELTRPR